MNVWLYDGTPEHIELKVRDASPEEGGYVVLLQLNSGEIRILGTRYPAKYVGSWKTSTHRHDGAALKRVIVSQPHPRYEKIKRLLATSMVPGSQVEIEPKGLVPETVETIMQKAKYLFSIAPANNANLMAASNNL